MPDSKLSPLAFNVPIVDPKTGFPTAYFMQMVATWLKENAFTDTTVETVQAEVDALEAEVAALELDDLVDVDTTGVADGDVLTYDSGSGDWVPEAPTGGSGSTEWTLVDQNGDPVVSSGAVTITIASPGVVTLNAHGFPANATITLSTTGALPTGLTNNKTYFVRNPTANTFELSLTTGGASINTSGTQSGTHSVTKAYTWAHSTNVASVDCINLGNYNEVMIFARNITTSASAARAIYVSTDNGSTVYNTSGDYALIDSAGVGTNTTAFIFHSSSTTSGRSLLAHIVNMKGPYPYVIQHNGTAVMNVFLANAAPINALRLALNAAGNMTAGQWSVWVR